jgi:gluconokinase
MLKPSVVILVMGVSGSGKTTVGQQLAAALGWQFSDADTFHSSENIEKMRRGIPLNEADRAPWLQALQTAIQSWLQANQNTVLACSALKASYRKILILDRDRVKPVYLKGSYQVIQARLQARQNHYMTAQLLDSQFAALEEPQDAVQIDVAQPPQMIVQGIRSMLGL